MALGTRVRAVLAIAVVRLALILTVLGAAACGSAAITPLSDEERCARYGGIWQAGTCKTTG
jgi:hypothetical protein